MICAPGVPPVSGRHDRASEQGFRHCRSSKRACAREWIETLEADARRDELLADPRSDALLQRLAGKAASDVASRDITYFDPANKP